MDADDYPSYESTAPRIPLPDNCLPSFEQLQAEYDAEQVSLAARSVPTAVKVETPTEIYKRVCRHKHKKQVKTVKTVAKKLVKRKQIKKITTYFG
jgi:hypothetical protein